MAEFKFPDEIEPKDTATDKATDSVDFEIEDETQIEIVDDTPEQDKGRKPLEKTVEEPTDDELAQYGEKVRNRIKELTHARHDERRAKEVLERQHQEAIRAAQVLAEENKKLKGHINTGTTAFVSQAQRLADVEVDKAKAALKAAHEAGDTEAFVEAQAKLNEAVFAQQRVKALKPTPLQTEEQRDTVAPQQPSQQAPVPQIDPATEAWKQRNPWFGQDDEMTSLAMGVHNKLVRSGYTPGSKEYFDTIDSRLRHVFPDKFEAPKPEPAKRPATVVAPTQRATSAKKIKLTQSQVAIARRLGVPLEEYARNVARLEQQNG
jgi:hypothetical protein